MPYDLTDIYDYFFEGDRVDTIFTIIFIHRGAQFFHIFVEIVAHMRRTIGLQSIANIVQFGSDIVQNIIHTLQNPRIPILGLYRGVIVMSRHTLLKEIDNIRKYQGQKTTSNSRILDRSLTLEKHVSHLFKMIVHLYMFIDELAVIVFNVFGRIVKPTLQPDIICDMVYGLGENLLCQAIWAHISGRKTYQHVPQSPDEVI